ncbi:MAG: hypothetical protein ACTSRW_16600 [Candidatus Helarchaeota archaeon]
MLIGIATCQQLLDTHYQNCSSFFLTLNVSAGGLIINTAPGKAGGDGPLQTIQYEP